MKCGFPSGATDQLVTSTTGVLLGRSMLEGSCGFRVPFGPWRQHFRHFRRRPPKRTILVNVRSTRPPIRRQTKPPRCFDPFDRVNLGMSLRHGLLPAPHHSGSTPGGVGPSRCVVAMTATRRRTESGDRMSLPPPLGSNADPADREETYGPVRVCIFSMPFRVTTLLAASLQDGLRRTKEVEARRAGSL